MDTKIVPNLLTAGRIPLTVIAVLLLIIKTPLALIGCLIVMTVIVISDFLDGYLARKYGWGSEFGKLFDPMSDAFYFLSMYIVLASIVGSYLAFFVVLILLRELLIMCLRAYWASQGLVMAARSGGKAKTVCHMVALYSFVVWLLAIACHYPASVSLSVAVLASISFIAAFCLTFYSLADYIIFAKGRI